MILALLGLAAAQDAERDFPVQGSVHGDLKTFFVATLPYENALLQDVGVLPADPTAQGIVDGRLKVELDAGRWSFQGHHAVTALTPSPALSVSSSGVGLTAPQALDLSWRAWDDQDQGDTAMALQGRTDRLNLAATFGPARITAGRQPVSLGNGLAFAPLDLVNPFFPSTIDQEYKPGVDALRVDLYFGFSTQITAVAAYAWNETIADAIDADDDWLIDGMVYALYAQRTFGRHDVGAMVAEVRGDEVFGLTLATYAGPVGLTSDLTFTLPADPDDEDPFFRGSLGAMWRPGAKTTLVGEVYYQSMGVRKPQNYLVQLSGDRYARGELWLAGRPYAMVSVNQEILPILFLNASLIGNLQDPSALGTLSLDWSVSDNVSVSAGAMMGLGERPDELELQDLLDPDTGLPYQDDALLQNLGVNSEFGFYPSSVFLQARTYF